MEDMIDFRCSDTFRDGYYEQGLTPYHSPSYYDPPKLPQYIDRVQQLLEILTEQHQRPLNEVEEENKQLRSRAKGLQQENARLHDVLAQQPKKEIKKPIYE